MIPYKSVFDIPDLTTVERLYLTRGDTSKLRMANYGVARFNALSEDERWRLFCQWENAPVTEEEYFEATTQLERYEDLFYLYIRRGEFDTAFEYEQLSGIDFEHIANIPQDVLHEDKELYKLWRFKDHFHRAIDIAKSAHKGQVDKAGNDYIDHPRRVMAMGKTTNEKIVGILHDVIEDTEWTFEMLEAEGFATEIIDTLRCVTKLSEDEPYDEFIERVKTNPLAVAVKINDLTDNMDIRRLEELTDKDFKRLQKYHWAYKKLKEHR